MVHEPANYAIIYIKLQVLHDKSKKYMINLKYN